MKLENVKNENDEIKTHYNNTGEFPSVKFNFNIGTLTIK